MFPIRDHNPSGRTPYVVFALIAINVVVFLAMLGLENDPGALANFYSQWAVVPDQIGQGHHLEALISSLFLHGGFMHLAGNMLFLWIFGDNLEDEMGHLTFLGFYLLAGVGAGLVHVIASPGSQVPTIGASGAIAAVMGGYLLLYPKARVDILVIFIIFFKIFTIRAWIMLGLWFALQFFGSITSDANAGGIAYWAHSGGFVVGLILVIPLWLKRGGAQYWDKTHGHPPHAEHKYKFTASRIPKIPRK